MTDTHVYDKAKYHYETISQAGLPDAHASNHIVPVFRWLIENDLMSEFFTSEGREPLERYRAGEVSIHELFEWWDTCLISDMISDQGNEFAMAYFDYDRGQYLKDYQRTLVGNLPSEFHVVYSNSNYAKLKRAIDCRYRQWSAKKGKPWWRFW
ncbi:hypothetical protein ACFONC_08440 [Luteimonas soli]|uniref:DUF7832 domain-containing protein n=1 Tax=Luteimonas soli TaxID=1648966 RepID=A0ABV7XLD5_9GAMM